MYIKEYKDKEGKKLYMFQAYLGTDIATGKRIRVTRKGFNSPKACEAEFYRLKFEVEDGNYKVKNKKYTFKEIYELWHEEYKSTVQESTLNKTTGFFRNRILPAYGKYYIDQIDWPMCQRVTRGWSKDMKSFKVYNNFAAQIFEFAIKMGLITENPAKNFKLPVVYDGVEKDKKENYYTKDELQAFFTALAKDDMPKWFAFFRTLAFSGCRKGELLALRWSNVDFTDNTITICRTVTRGMNNKIIIQEPKTKGSNRTLPMDPETMAILKAWKATQAKDMLKLGHNTLNKEQLVFTSHKNTIINPQRVGNKLNQICKNNNLRRISTHGFRHTHCTLLFEIPGMTAKEVQLRLGHSSIQTTLNIYTHVTDGKRKETATKFAEYVSI